MRLLRRKEGPSLDSRLDALLEAATLAEGRLPGGVVGAARVVAERAGARRSLSAEHTVVALAGATGSGKSSLFNALAGAEVATVGVTRPTTSAVQAAVWDGAAGAAGPLLDWLDVFTRYQAGVPSGSPTEPDLSGLILLDLPDHDSIQLGHRLEVDRLVELVDLLVWVVDPQKYADAALHERYLRPLSGHRDVMVVALNQADRLPPDAVDRCLGDVRRLLDEDGLKGVPVLATSARTGRGLAELRALLARRVADRRAWASRLAADVTTAADLLAAASVNPPEVPAFAGENRHAPAAPALASADVPGTPGARGTGTTGAHGASGAPATPASGEGLGRTSGDEGGFAASSAGLSGAGAASTSTGVSGATRAAGEEPEGEPSGGETSAGRARAEEPGEWGGVLAAGREITRSAELPEAPAGEDVSARLGRRLTVALEEAAGVPLVLEAVAKGHRHRAVVATGWPVTRWIRRLRPDPLRRLRLGTGVGTGTRNGTSTRNGRGGGTTAAGGTPGGTTGAGGAIVAQGGTPAAATPALRGEGQEIVGRTSLPAASAVQKARVETAVRDVGEAAGTGLPVPWEAAVRRAARARSGELADAVDRAVGRTSVQAARPPRWWKAVGAVQWLVFATMLVGALWLGVLFGLDYLRLPELPVPTLGVVPWPTVLLAGGALAGILVALLSRLAAWAGGRRRARRTAKAMRAAIGEVGAEYVLRPVEAELDAYTRFRDAVERARA
ncbi:YfjP family GTPase [Nonomuraea montanisoli]|uniref:YfjP family GTPase n=1 Tax=Nonomuraea montanisoli TaxID=2741721 RepID=UPI001F1E6E80|nr:YfjP family GTPase [Nonomuraea montanisoli]